MKIIRIENCEACVPYYSCVPGVDGPYCNKQERYIYRDEIPSWCPLEDVPDTGEDFGTVSNNEMRAFNASRTGFIGTRSEEGD